MRESGTQGEVRSVMTRRRIIGAAATLAGLSAAFGTQSVAAQEMKKVPAKSGNAKRTSLHQEVGLPASPDRIYHLLLDSNEFAELSGMPAEIEGVAGGAFAMFGKAIYGRNVELVPNERVIQAWGDTGWGPGVYSIARFELKKQGSGTRVVLDHTGFPEGSYDHLYVGWKGHYWEPMQKYFSGK
ncbi:MAG TPA: SRPBCC domain-containing protein [Candidatus Eisenbacteria bacterium]|nr:SRPBCC domain-containing protein [Candidatus Eisenbacteria bacterium]